MLCLMTLHNFPPFVGSNLISDCPQVGCQLFNKHDAKPTCQTLFNILAKFQGAIISIILIISIGTLKATCI